MAKTKNRKAEVIYGLVINIKTAQFIVDEGQVCEEHGKPLHVVTLFDGGMADSKCFDCLVDMFAGMIDIAIETTANQYVDSG